MKEIKILTVIISGFRIINYFFCYILYIFQIFSLRYFYRHKILFYKVESLLMSTREAVPVSGTNPFPFRRHIS